MAQQETNVLGLELETVLKKVPALFDREVTFYSRIEKRNVEQVSNRSMRIPLEMRPGGRFGHYDPDGGDLGRGDASQFDKAVIDTVHLRYAVEWTKKAEWATDSERKAVLQAFKHNLAKAMIEFRRGFDALCCTSGNGVLGTILTVNSTTDFVLDSEFGIKLLRYGQIIKIYDTTLATDRTAAITAQINFYDLPNKRIKINNAVAGTTAGDKVVIEGVSGANPVSMLGVYYHHNDASTGTWLGFDRSLTPEIRANRVNASSSSFVLPFARLAMNKAMDRVGSDEVPKLEAWTHPCQLQAYEETGQTVSEIHKSASDEKLNLYFNPDGMQMAGCPVKSSFKWSKKRIDFIWYDYWGRAEMHPAGFYDVEGRKIFELRGTSGGVATGQIFYLVASFNLFMTNPAAATYIDTLAVPSGY